MDKKKVTQKALRRWAFGLFLVALALLVPQDASSIGTLTGTWSCGAYASCLFVVTSHNHAAYQWNFGDGNFSGVQTSTSVYHTYNISQGTDLRHFQVYVMAYATVNGGSPDNIIGCYITTYKTTVGGDPTTFSGDCS